MNIWGLPGTGNSISLFLLTNMLPALYGIASKVHLTFNCTIVRMANQRLTDTSEHFGYRSYITIIKKLHVIGNEHSEWTT